MPVPRPQFFQGQYYHIYNRGAHRESIFRCEENYLFVLQRLKKYSLEFDLTLIAYCLMPNHYHFLIRQDGEKRAGLLPQGVFNSYAKAFNRQYGHSGTIFEGPYRIQEVKQEAHLFHLCRYIHGNPVKDALVSNPEDWPYSNYLEFIGLRQGRLVDKGFVVDSFGSANGYRKFVYEDLCARNLPAEIRIAIGKLEE